MQLDASPNKETCSQSESENMQLMHRTNCGIVQQNGQRGYGPPENWEGPPPPRGCEVFVGKIPRDCFEDELVPVFENVGKIYEMRIMMKNSGYNRGYAFVVYSSPAEAKECVKVLNNYEIRKGRTLGVCRSVENCRLYVGGIPKKVVKEDIWKEMLKVTEGVVDVIVYPSASDKTKNRGFAFIEYESHRAAAMARRKLMSSRAQLWEHQVAVDWAEPELEVDVEVMAQVKVLYIRNLMLSTTEGTIEEAFSKHAPVERVKKIRDYAFVHFFSREGALQAMQAMNGYMIEGALLGVTWAKPVDKDTCIRSPKPHIAVAIGNHTTLKYLPRNSIGAYTLPMWVDAGPTKTPPSPVRHSFYSQGGYYDPKTMLSEDPFGHSLHKSPVQVLEEACQRNNWGPPLYSLYGTKDGYFQLYQYKVTMASLGTAYLPSKLSPSVNEGMAMGHISGTTSY